MARGKQGLLRYLERSISEDVDSLRQELGENQKALVALKKGGLEGVEFIVMVTNVGGNLKTDEFDSYKSSDLAMAVSGAEKKFMAEHKWVSFRDVNYIVSVEVAGKQIYFPEKYWRRYTALERGKNASAGRGR